MPLWLDGQIAIALGVGYSQPNLSHFRSIEIWETATASNSYGEIGWLARLFRENPPPASLPANGILLGRNAPGPFSGDSGRVIALKNLEKMRIRKRKNRTVTLKKANPLLAHVVDVQNRMDLVERRLVAKKLNNVVLSDDFPLHNFGTQMKTAAKLIVGGSGVPIIKCSLGSFDTHAGQIQRHRGLMMQLAEGLSSFSRAMKNAGKWDDILIMTYSEFGRRPRENASGGTDHGTAAPHFFMGGKVNGGFFGEQPPLNDLNGLNLSYRTDFRILYATVARQWFGLKAPFLGSRTLPILRAV